MNNVDFKTKNNSFNGYITKIHHETTLFGHIDTVYFNTDYGKFSIKENRVTIDSKPFSLLNYINKRIVGVVDILYVDKLTIVIKLEIHTLEYINDIEKEIGIFFDNITTTLYVGINDNKIYLEVTADYRD